MNKHSMIFIVLDTHIEFHGVAYCEEQREAGAVHYGCKQPEVVFNKLRGAV
jgi:transposase